MRKRIGNFRNANSDCTHTKEWARSARVYMANIIEKEDFVGSTSGTMFCATNSANSAAEMSGLQLYDLASPIPIPLTFFV
jgi:hypothetical protein